MKQNTSWRTTVAGWMTGLMPVVYAVLTAYNNGQFDGKNVVEMLFGIGVIVLGTMAKDSVVTGVPGEQTAAAVAPAMVLDADLLEKTFAKVLGNISEALLSGHGSGIVPAKAGEETGLPAGVVDEDAEKAKMLAAGALRMTQDGSVVERTGI